MIRVDRRAALADGVRSESVGAVLLHQKENNENDDQENDEADAAKIAISAPAPTAAVGVKSTPAAKSPAASKPAAPTAAAMKSTAPTRAAQRNAGEEAQQQQPTNDDPAVSMHFDLPFARIVSPA